MTTIDDFLNLYDSVLLHDLLLLLPTKNDLNGFLRVFYYHPKIKALSHNARFQRKWQMYHVGLPLFGHATGDSHKQVSGFNIQESYSLAGIKPSKEKSYLYPIDA